MIIVTGGAGFIGSCIVSRLNAFGRGDLTIVDHLNDLKNKNLDGKKYEAYFDKKEFLALLRNNQIRKDVEAIIHMGACSSTTLTDARYFEENNYQYSCHIAEFCLQNNIRLIYASSASTYGDGALGYDDDESKINQLKPLNLYGLSKQKFDQWVLSRRAFDKVVGLKFFNVFGPNEYHKADMRSVIAKVYEDVCRLGKMSLFKSYHPDFQDGEQKRDFIYVKDAVDIVMHFLDHPQTNGIYNVGTGSARTWNDLARALFQAVNKASVIEYIEMPEILRSKYQYFTQARVQKLRNSGYLKPFTSLEDSVKDYVSYLKDHRYL